MDLLKEGTKHLTGLEEVILRNIDAIRKLSQITRTSLGPNGVSSATCDSCRLTRIIGMNKVVVNHLEKLFVTSDTATIIKELDVMHPAAKMVVLAAQQAESEVGDGTNLVVTLAGELMLQAESLIRMGLHSSLVVEGYTNSAKKALEILDDLCVYECKDLRDVQQVTKCLSTVVGAKQYGLQDELSPLIAKSCINVLPQDPVQFNVDNVRVAKILGGGVLDTTMLNGFVVTRDAEGCIKHVRNAKVVVYAGGVDAAKTETKGTVLLHNAKELLQYSRGEEEQIEQLIKAIAESGANVVVSGSSIGELAMHYMERYQLMVVKITSKFELRRLCKAVNAIPLLQLAPPANDNLGRCDVVTVDEVGSTKVTIFRQEKEHSNLSTILIRAATPNVLDDVARAVDDGVSVFKQMCKDRRFVAGAGACEIELAVRLGKYGESCPGLDQYSIMKFAEAFEVVPRTLSENAGHSSTEILSQLYASHQAGKTNSGVNIEGQGLVDALEMGILDHLATKKQVIELASNAAVTVLQVDQIIMQKPAGGPKPPQGGGAMDGGEEDVPL